MSFFLKLITFIASFFFGIYVMRIVLFSLFYDLPRFLREKRKGNLSRSIPFAGLFIIPPSYAFGFFLIVYFTLLYFPITQVVVRNGLILALIFTLYQLLIEKEQRNRDFVEKYEEYLIS